MRANRLPGITKLGSCQDCIILSLALFGLSLLLLGLGGITNLTIVFEMGQVASAAFGLLLSLHALFFFLKRKKLVAEQPQLQQLLQEQPQQPRRRCCGS